jgi:hypothetical protein
MVERAPVEASTWHARISAYWQAMAAVHRSPTHRVFSRECEIAVRSEERIEIALFGRERRRS